MDEPSSTSSATEFTSARLLRCHSKRDDNPFDDVTQIWQAVFQPSKESTLVATCGGNTVCVIEVETAVVMYRYTYDNGLLYTISWSAACPNNNILATGGTSNTIVFIDLFTNSAYLQYLLSQNTCTNLFINSIVFHPYEKKLFCGQNNGGLYVLSYDIENNRIVNIKEICSICLDCEIIGLEYSSRNDCLLIATNTGLKGWNNNQNTDQVLLNFEFPDNPRDKNRNDEIIDSVTIVKNSWIATKVATHGVIYIFNLNLALINMENNKCFVNPAYVLNWSKTENYYMNCGVGDNGKLLACGNDKGEIWIYSFEKLNFNYYKTDAEVIEAKSIFKWPKISNSNLKKKNLDTDDNNIVVAKCAISHNGKYIVCVTLNNLVCIYTLD